LCRPRPTSAVSNHLRQRRAVIPWLLGWKLSFFYSDSWGSNPLQEISVHELLAKDKVTAARQWLPGEGRALTRSGRERGHSCPRVGRKNRSVQTEGRSTLASKVSQQTCVCPSEMARTFCASPRGASMTA